MKWISFFVSRPMNQNMKAQCDNDTDELFSIQQTFIEAKEKAMKADWMKSMPKPPAGNDDCPVSKEQFRKMKYSERVAFKQKYPEMYKEWQTTIL